MDTLLTGEAKPAAAIRARWAMGASRPGDVIWTTHAVPVLLSDRVVGVLREGKFSGWDVVPVELRDKAGGLLPTYYFLCIHGRCGPIDNSRSTKIDKIYPGGIFPAWIGLYFDKATWDGSDLFVPEGTGLKVVVEPVKLALEKAKVKNVEFEPLDEVENQSMALWGT